MIYYLIIYNRSNNNILLQRNGANYAVFINTSSEFDGSDSGARPEEAISWGKIQKDATPVKVVVLSFLIPNLLNPTNSD